MVASVRKVSADSVGITDESEVTTGGVVGIALVPTGAINFTVECRLADLFVPLKDLFGDELSNMGAGSGSFHLIHGGALESIRLNVATVSPGGSVQMAIVDTFHS